MWELLRYYSDGSWGYEWDDEEKLAAGLEIVAVQEPHEFNARFWDRVGDRPKKQYFYGMDDIDDRNAALGDEKERCEAAANASALDRLINDESPLVRAAVVGTVAAWCHYGLDRLVYDESPLVRIAVALLAGRREMDILREDEDDTVRYVAWHRQLPHGSQYEDDIRYLLKLRGQHTVPIAPY